MSYTLKQFRYAGGPDSRSVFSNVVKYGEAKRDSIVMTKFYLNEILSFKNVGKTYDPNKNYFFHGMIKQLPSQQVFYVRLIQDEVNGNNELIYNMQETFLKTRRESCNEINKKFGTNISVEFVKEVKEVGEIYY